MTSDWFTQKSLVLDAETAFSHTIYRDLSDAANMIVGFAETFRNSLADRNILTVLVCCSRLYLTCQKIYGVTVLYGLVTKPSYCDKPFIHKCDTSLEELTDKFKMWKLKKLTCFPMGCNRDIIPLQDFASKIFEFQQTTGVSA